MAKSADTYVVELQAKTSAYKAKMKEAIAATEELEEALGAGEDGTESFGDQMKKSSSSVSRFSSSVESVGTKMSSVTAKITSAASGIGSFVSKVAGITAIATVVNKGVNAVISGVSDMYSTLEEGTEAWTTFEANMTMNGHTTDEIAAAKKSMQDYASATVYSASEMASAYAQLDAIGVKNVDALVKGVGGLAASASDPSQAMTSLMTQITQAAGKSTIAWQDFRIMLEQAPAGVAAVAKTMGMSTSEMVNAIQDGKVATQDFLNAVASTGTNANFTALSTQFKTVSQAIDGAKEAISNRLQPAFSNLQTAGIRAVEAISGALEKLTPYINAVINAISAGLDLIARGIAKITGIKLSSGSTKLTANTGGKIDTSAYDTTEDTASAQEDVANNTNDATKATKAQTRAVKEATKAQSAYNATTLSFDVKHALGGGNTSSGSTSDDAGSGTVTKATAKTADAVSAAGTKATDTLGDITSGFETIATEEEDQPGLIDGINEKISGIKPIIDGVINEAKRLSGQFKNGFKIGLGDVSPQIEKIKDAFTGIKTAWNNIWSDSSVQDSVKTFAEKAAYNLGLITGSGIRIGINLGTNLVSGFSQYLNENKDRIKETIEKVLTNGGTIFDNLGTLAQAKGKLSDTLTSEDAIGTTANVFGIAGSITGSTAELASSIAADISTMFSKPIADNVENIKKALESTWDDLNGITGTLKQMTDDAGDSINRIYDESIHPIIMKITDGFSAFIEGFTTQWTKLTGLEEMVQRLYDEHIKPMMDELEKAWSEISAALSPVVENILNPILEILGAMLALAVKLAACALVKILEGLADALTGLFKVISSVANGISKVTAKIPSLSSFADKITGKSKTSTISGYASGGQINSGQIFMARENGMAEMVGSIGTTTTVANNDQIVSAVSSGVAQAVAGVMSQYQTSDNNQGGDIVINVDSEELARAVSRGNKRYNTRTNPRFAFS